MLVHAYWANAGTENEVFSEMSAAWRVDDPTFSGFQSTLAQKLFGGTVKFPKGGNLLVIGGRDSIESAFRCNPVAGYGFEAAAGEMLYFSARRKTHKTATMASLTAPFLAKAAVTNQLDSVMMDKFGKLFGAHMKKYTVLHILSANSDPNGGTALGYPPIGGAQLAQVLKQIVFSKI